jgi:hypothetical protein
MDPYLEDAALWEGFHHRLIGVLDELLTLRVPPAFYVEQQAAVYILEPGVRQRPPIRPDLFLVEAGPITTGGRTTATVERPITEPTIVTARYPEEMRQRYLEIRDATSHRVVTVIELLSPTNKTPGAGRDAFVRKRHDVMASSTHWLEIDLLREGERPPEVADQSDYYALLRRGGAAEQLEIWFCNLRDELPVIAVPLTSSFSDIALDLQAAFTRTYDRYYAARLTYEAAPPSRCTPADAAWVAERVRAWRAAGVDERTR